MSAPGDGRGPGARSALRFDLHIDPWRIAQCGKGALARFARRYRLLELWVATGVLFHLALAVLTKLGIFPWGCLALFPALARPEQWRTWLWRPRRAERARQVTLTAT